MIPTTPQPHNLKEWNGFVWYAYKLCTPQMPQNPTRRWSPTQVSCSYNSSVISRVRCSSGFQAPVCVLWGMSKYTVYRLRLHFVLGSPLRVGRRHKYKRGRGMFQGLGQHLSQSDDLQATKRTNTRPKKKIPATQRYWITNYCWQLSCSHLPHHQMEEEALSWYQCRCRRCCCCCWTLDKVFLRYFNVCSWCVRHRATLSEDDTSRDSLLFSCQVLWKHIQNDKWDPHLLTSIALEMLHWVIMQVSGWQLGGPSFVSPSHLAKLQGPLQLSSKISWVLPLSVWAHNAKLKIPRS